MTVFNHANLKKKRNERSTVGFDIFKLRVVFEKWPIGLLEKTTLKHEKSSI
jgi:hypothetical protein